MASQPSRDQTPDAAQSPSAASPAKEGPQAYWQRTAEGTTVVRIFDPIDVAHVFVEAGVDDQLVFKVLQELHPEYIAQKPLPKVLVYRLSEWPEAVETFAADYLSKHRTVDLARAKHKAERAEAHGKRCYMVYLVR
jgi:hypothetical protein